MTLKPTKHKKSFQLNNRFRIVTVKCMIKSSSYVTIF